MKIDVQEIIVNKLAEMEKDRVLEKKIEEMVESTLLKTIENTMDSYGMRMILQEKFEKEVRHNVNKIGLTAYNTLLVNEMERIMQTVVKEDIAEKLKKLCESIFVQKREYIELSEIVEEYRKLYDDMEYKEWEEMNGHFSVIWQEKADTLKLCFSQYPQKEGSYFYDGDEEEKLVFYMIVHTEQQKDGTERRVGSIYHCDFEGKKLYELQILQGYLSSFEALIANLCLNDTKIVIDIEEDDIDTSVGDFEY